MVSHNNSEPLPGLAPLLQLFEAGKSAAFTFKTVMELCRQKKHENLFDYV